LERAKAGHFREDLFYRLHVLPLTVPPLRTRREDIPHLTRHFLARFRAEENRDITSVSADALTALASFGWPGNVRQLENAIYRAVVMSERSELGLSDFPMLAGHDAPRTETELPKLDLDHQADTAPSLAGSDIPIAPLVTLASLPLLTAEGEVRPIEEIEAEVIRFAITHYRGQMSEVARRLGIGRSTLYRKLEAIDGEEPTAG
jgi:DNA-binding NtrC family response regulator